MLPTYTTLGAHFLANWNVRFNKSAQNALSSSCSVSSVSSPSCSSVVVAFDSLLLLRVTFSIEQSKNTLPVSLARTFFAKCFCPHPLGPMKSKCFGFSALCAYDSNHTLDVLAPRGIKTFDLIDSIARFWSSTDRSGASSSQYTNSSAPLAMNVLLFTMVSSSSYFFSRSEEQKQSILTLCWSRYFAIGYASMESYSAFSCSKAEAQDLGHFVDFFFVFFFVCFCFFAFFVALLLFFIAASFVDFVEFPSSSFLVVLVVNVASFTSSSWRIRSNASFTFSLISIDTSFKTSLSIALFSACSLKLVFLRSLLLSLIS